MNDQVMTYESLCYELEKLTPNGSEYHQNPKQCLQFIQDRLTNARRIAMQAIQQRNEMIQENNTLKTRIAELERGNKSE